MADISNPAADDREANGQDAAANPEMELLLASIRSIMISLDGDDRVRRFNASAERHLGLSREAALGQRLFDLPIAWNAEAVREAIAASRRLKEPVRLDEIRCRRPDGVEWLFGLTVNPIKGDREPPGILILGQDITGIKVRERKASHELRMESIGRLAAGIAHEINTPVQYVGYNAGFLGEAFAELIRLLDRYRQVTAAVLPALGPAESAVRQAIEAVEALAMEMDIDYLVREIPNSIANSRKGINQVAEIVKAMRLFSHPGTGERVLFDVNAAVRDTVVVSRNAWKHVAELTQDLDPGLPLVYGLPHEVSQVLLNVLLNAAQAVEEAISLEPWSKGRITVRTYVEGGFVTVAVTDTGPGIPEAVQARIFDPFFTTKEVGKGTGQGLSISHAVMARHGGEIDFETKPGEGTTFFLRFPEDRMDGQAGGRSSGVRP